MRSRKAGPPTRPRYRSLICRRAQQLTLPKSTASLDLKTFVHFLLFSLIITPPNYLWQKFLEDTFPTRLPGSKTSLKRDSKTQQSADGEFSVSNTVIKFILDQSLGCWINTFLFIVGMGMLKGGSTAQIVSTLQHDFWSMVFASYKLWPAVCLVNLVLVPFDYRMFVGNMAAFGWGIYMSLLAS